MKSYFIDDIVEDVRITLDMNSNSKSLEEFGDTDTLSINEIIKSKITEAVQSVHSIAPPHLLDGGHIFGDAIYWADMQSGWVMLPDDFMRFIVFQMSDWTRAVYHAIETSDPQYELQSAPYKGLRGTYNNPVCAIATRHEGRVLEFYSCKDENATVKKALYIPYPKIEDNHIEICEKCYKAVVYAIAALVLIVFGDTEKSNIYNELAKGALI